ncbi:ATP/GTP-binding protein [Clostridia bacterium]|nr:ATP/GTP-binding protein [Clostridia bacterium]
MEQKEFLSYSLGALMYTPATNKTIAQKLISGEFRPNSVALCLEDAIGDVPIKVAEKQLFDTLREIKAAAAADLPLIFIRIRTPLHMSKIFSKLEDLAEIVSGFVLPKFSLANAADYKTVTYEINTISGNNMFVMPILENDGIIGLENRAAVLAELKGIIDNVRDLVLNVRVGGNDFCNLFAIRRNINQTIYDISVINSVISDILNVFSGDYVVSAPVWEYFQNETSDDWLDGLKRELELDRLNGFIGKTAIHPSQIAPIQESLKVSNNDYQDALTIKNWTNKDAGVEKSYCGMRMNEVKVHEKWARKILLLASIYGVRDADLV